MRNLHKFLDEPVQRILFFIAFGILIFVIQYLFPGLRESLFLYSFIVSMFAGLFGARLRFTECVVTVFFFFIGWLLSPSIIALAGSIGHQGLMTALKQYSALLLFSKVALMVFPVFIIPWIVGLPLGYFVGRKLL